MAKGKRLTIRLDDELDAIIKHACIDGNCDKSTIVIHAIKKGLEVDDDSDSRYVRHRSNPNIKLVKQIYENGETRYMDTNGGKWIMNNDKTLIPIATVHIVESEDSKREVKQPDGSIDVYKDGKLQHKAIPPKVAGGRWTYVLYT